MGRGRIPDSPTDHKSRKLMDLNGDEIFNLPEEIITEVILRLPVKSIAKFRCLSKSWLSLISSKRFIKNHLNVSKNHPNANGHRVILSVCCPESLGIKLCKVGSLMRWQTLMQKQTVTHERRSLPVQTLTKGKTHKAFWVMGICNGLICIVRGTKDFILWNQATKESMKLPSIHLTVDTPYYSVFGFGFDESNDDYKVVRILCWFEDDGMFVSAVNIYSLKSDSWKSIEDFKGGSPLDDYGVFVNGKLHWSATSANCSNLKWDIVSLDLETELYTRVEQPTYLEGGFDAKLGVLGAFICVLCNYGSNRVDLWVLKEYGNKESWSKLFTLECDWNLSYPKPVCMLTVLVFRNFFLLYNPIYGSIRIIQINNLNRIVRSDILVESLVSPIANGRLTSDASDATSVMKEKDAVVDEVCA